MKIKQSGDYELSAKLVVGFSDPPGLMSCELSNSATADTDFGEFGSAAASPDAVGTMNLLVTPASQLAAKTNVVLSCKNQGTSPASISMG